MSKDILLLELKTNQNQESRYLDFARKLSKIKTERLYRQYGHPSFKKFLENELSNITPRAVYSRLRVLKFLETYSLPDSTLEFGASKLEILSTHCLTKSGERSLKRPQVLRLLGSYKTTSFDEFRSKLQSLRKRPTTKAFRLTLREDEYKLLTDALEKQKSDSATTDKDALISIITEWLVYRGETGPLKLTDILKVIKR
jgi:hypothetical protein